MLVGVKGISQFSFLALHQWNFPWSDYCVSTVCILCYLIPPAEVEAFHHSITEKQREDTQGRDKQTIYMNFYEHRKIRLSRELRSYTGLNSCTICWTARNAENHLLPISLNLIKIHKTADYPFLFADLIFFWSPPIKTHITGCIYLSKSGVNMFWYKTRTSEFQRAFLCKIKR